MIVLCFIDYVTHPTVASIPGLKSRNHGAPVAPACFKVVELLVVSSCSNRGVVCLVVQTLILRPAWRW